MSLLEDVSIVVTPNGYKAGTLYGVLPTYAESADKVTDGDFPLPNVNWTLGGAASITVDGLKIDNTVITGNGYAFQGITGAASGKRYVLTYDVIATNGKNLRLDQATAYTLDTSTTGTNRKFYFAWDRPNIYLNIKRIGADTDVTIDNVILQEVTSSDMDVTRATAATRVDEDGLVNYAEIIGDELVTNGDFATDSYWDKTGTWSIESNYATASGNSTSQYIQQDFTITNGKTYLFTYEIIENTLNGVGSALSGTGGFVQVFLSNVVGTHQVYITADDDAAAYALKIGVSATATTGTIKLDNVSVKEVTRDNVPRIDYTGGGCPHILAEPQRTNLITYSEDFSQSYWTKSGSSVTSNSVTSPDGTLNAYKLVEDTSTAQHRLRATNATITPGTVTQTIFAKAAERTWILVQENDMGGYYFNLSTGVVGSSSGLPDSNTITSMGNGWYKITVTITTANAFAKFSLYPATGDNSSSYTGDGTSGVYIWGAQLEVGSYATSYIPNSGTDAGVTRNQDQFTRDGIGSLINDSEGVLFVEMAFSDEGRLAILNSDASDDQVVLGFSGTVFCRIRENGANVVTQFVSSANQLNTYYKIAVKYKSGSSAIWVDGNETVVAGTFTLNDLSKILFISEGSRTYGKVRQIQVYPSALTTPQLRDLTT